MSILDYFRPRKKKKEKIEKQAKLPAAAENAQKTSEAAEIREETANREQSVLNPVQNVAEQPVLPIHAPEKQDELSQLRSEYAEIIKIFTADNWEDAEFWDKKKEASLRLLIKYTILEANGKKKLNHVVYKLVDARFENQLNNLFKLPADTLEKLGIPMEYTRYVSNHAFHDWLDQGNTCSQQDYIRYSGGEYETETYIYKLADEIPEFELGEE